MLGLAALAFLAKKLSFWLQRGEPSPVRSAICKMLMGLPVLHVRRKARDFFESLALLLEAGVPMFDALPIAVESIDNPIMQPAFGNILTKMQSGASLSQALAGVPYLNHDILIPFVQTGEVSGALSEMLWRHVNMETTAINHFQLQCVEWFPRIFYALVVVWIVSGTFTSR
ncbi:type II secretion system F family protein [Chitinimonas sp. PSY-7]|uniref:type II secretion system F family protein n=1 Tax=Chitinimonas sp. PSY-7 TaxID=3459088 RepID=UPI0040403E50